MKKHYPNELSLDMKNADVQYLLICQKLYFISQQKKELILDLAENWHQILKIRIELKTRLIQR